MSAPDDGLALSLADARQQLRLEAEDTSEDDALLGYIKDAQAWVEEYTGQILIARDVTETFAGFSRLQLRAWPIAADAVPVVTYVGADQSAVAVTDVRIDVGTRPARVLPSVGTTFPVVPSDTVVTVIVRAGYEDRASIPGNMRRAMLMLVGAYYWDREGGETFAKSEESAKKQCSRLRRRTL